MQQLRRSSHPLLAVLCSFRLQLAGTHRTQEAARPARSCVGSSSEGLQQPDVPHVTQQSPPVAEQAPAPAASASTAATAAVGAAAATAAARCCAVCTAAGLQWHVGGACPGEFREVLPSSHACLAWHHTQQMCVIAAWVIAEPLCRVTPLLVTSFKSLSLGHCNLVNQGNLLTHA